MLSIERQEKIKKLIIDFFQKEKLFENLKIDRKADNTDVTEIDYFICKTIKEEIGSIPELAGYNYFSEEDHGELIFPSTVLDPIDGTRGLMQGFPECALSLGLMKSDIIDDGWGWIFNPFTGFSITSSDLLFKSPNNPEGKLLGLVSRSEWNRGLYTNLENSSFSVTPKGSIAYKLGILASGGCDFVITKRPKHIWDVAGGTIICSPRGINLYGPNGKITKLNEKKIEPSLLWCKDEHYEVLKHFLD